MKQTFFFNYRGERVVFKIMFLFFILLAMAIPARAQVDSLEYALKVLARTTPDSIVLRWAPTQAQQWLDANRAGYYIERYTLLRDGKLLEQPERKLLTPAPLRPLPLDAWEPLVKTDRYAAIAAQALYGATFELANPSPGVFDIVNKARENDQRHGFALFSADLSPAVARALALRFTDKQVTKGEKYLYRLIVVRGAPDYDSLRGSVFVEPELQELPKPIDLMADFKGTVVELRWEVSLFRGTYTAYRVERADNGRAFQPLSDQPLVSVTLRPSDPRYFYYTDTIAANQRYAYQVRGLTAFGEWGPPSDPVEGTSLPDVTDFPHLTRYESTDNRTIELAWEFDSTLHSAIKGFDVVRSTLPTRPFTSVAQALLPPEARTFTDPSPAYVNYYKVIAVGHNGREYPSMVHHAALVDSIPPVAPVGLKGDISPQGVVTLSWTPNTESDIYGYRIYRGNILKEEFSQITREPINQIPFYDTVNVKTLNKNIHYQVMAIDRVQNYSKLSAVLTLPLPDQVPPVAPVFLSPKATKEGALLRWTPGGSQDVSHYDLYRRVGGTQWLKISSQPHTADSVFTALDNQLAEGKSEVYTVVAVDSAGLESPPAEPVRAGRQVEKIKPAVEVKGSADRDNKRIVLTWNYNEPSVIGYQVYRAREGEPIRLLATVQQSTFEDKQMLINTRYTYQVVAVFQSGARSAWNKGFVIVY
ncbi:MAG: hypothetical protein ACOYXA_15885 [Bacteroidota bacterium]